MATPVVLQRPDAVNLVLRGGHRMERVRVVPLHGSAPERVVHLGHGERAAPLRYDGANRTLALPPAWMGELGLTPDQEVHVRPRDGGQRLRLGPLVGLWVTRAVIRQWTPSLRVLMQEARAAGAIPVVFDLDGIDRRRGRVAGWVERGGKPARAVLPLPDVIYNRATYPNLRRRARARELRRQLIAVDRIPFVNTAAGFPKWETYEALRFFRATRELVPATIRFGDRKTFAGFLRRYPVAFLKADGGSAGGQVLRIQAARGGWRVQGRNQRMQIQQRFGHLDDLHAFLTRLTEDGQWVLQEGIPLPQLEGRPWDVRLEAKKNGQGEWEVPFIFVRWGPPAAVVTNEAQGADIFLLEDFRTRFAGLKVLRDLDAVATRVGRLVAMALEARYGLQGEVGVDFGLDRQGRPKVFEANAKSTHAPVPGQTVPQARWPMQYAVWLAGRAWAGRETGLALPIRSRLTVGGGDEDAAP